MSTNISSSRARRLRETATKRRLFCEKSDRLKAEVVEQIPVLVQHVQQLTVVLQSVLSAYWMPVQPYGTWDSGYGDTRVDSDSDWLAHGQNSTQENALVETQESAPMSGCSEEAVECWIWQPSLRNIFATKGTT